MGDEGKAVGCVPPTALLSLRGLRILDIDQRHRLPRCGWDYALAGGRSSRFDL